MKTLLLLMTAVLAGCAAVSLGREYDMKLTHETARITTTLPSGHEKKWNIYAHPTDASRILVTESRGTSFGKNIIPIAPLLFDMTAAPAFFDDAVEAYLSKQRPGCTIARSTEIQDLNGYEYRIRCDSH